MFKPLNFTFLTQVAGCFLNQKHRIDSEETARTRYGENTCEVLYQVDPITVLPDDLNLKETGTGGAPYTADRL